MRAARGGRPPKEVQRNAREDLLEAATRHFARHGFGKGALADIAADAGVSIGMVRHYFGSKDGLIETCNQVVTDALGEIFRNILDGELPADGPNFIDELQRRTTAQLQGQVHLLYYLKQLSIDQPEAGTAVFRDYFQSLQGELNRLEALGHLRKGANKVWLTFQLMFMQMGPVYLSEQIEAIIGTPAHSSAAIRERGEENVSTLKHGILADQKRR